MPVDRSELWRLLALMLVGAWVAASAAHARVPSGVAISVDSLLARANRAFSQSDPAVRGRSLGELEEATLREPARADVWLARGRANLEMGHFALARTCLARACRLAPDDAIAWRSLALAWKMDWLCSVEPASLDHALDCSARACQLAPARAEDWTLLAALELVRGRPGPAIVAGLRGRAVDPEAAGPLLMLGSALFRSGEIALADSSFSAALPLLPADVRARFEDSRVVNPVRVSRADTPDADPKAAAREDWAAVDPDLTTPENEALLDFRTRVAMALFLFSERGEVTWDMRAELFARYGPPSSIDYNPAGGQIGWDTDLEFHFPGSRMSYPYNLQVWHFDALGMTVGLWDRSLMHHYELPTSETREMDPRPDPGLMAQRQDVVTLGAGRGVFRALPPGARPIRVSATVSRFPQADSARVLAHIFAPGTLTDSLQGAWAVAAVNGRVLMRGTQPLTPAACDPTDLRVAEFSALLPEGDYQLHLTVSGSGKRRGIARTSTRVEPSGPGLAMSDLVLMCTPPAVAIGPGGVRIEPQLLPRLSGTSDATIYYELDRLVTGDDGLARFVYTYTVRPVDPADPEISTRSPVFEASREESTPGSHRRQFVNVPVANLKPGWYELDLTVRDLRSDRSVMRRLRFRRDESRSG